MPRTNPLQKISTDLAKELGQSRQKANRSKVVPFGMEQVDTRTAMERLKTMTRADLESMPVETYRSLVDSVGPQAIIQVINRQQDSSFL